MKRLVWIRTAPPDAPGSMAAYAELVRRAVAPFADGWEFTVCDLFDPRGGGSMWRHHLWRLRHARRILASHPADLYHWLDGSMAAFMPPALRSRSVATVHDLIPLLQWRGELPGKPSWPAGWLIRRGVEALRGCAALCADSAATRDDLTRLAGIAERVAVVPVPLRPLPPPRPVPVAGLPSNARFILHVGHNAAYKNRAGVVDAFARLGDVPDLHLVLVGPPPTSELRARSAALANVHFVGPVDDAALHDLYRRAALFLFPSLYEGYGMPVLEAMAAGCPVVCSTAPALVEVAGEAVLCAPAEDADALAGQCRRLLADVRLRREQIARGLARAAAFDVATMGWSLLEWYNNVLERMKNHG
ncbi:MAG: glycosyltransferase family 1 protein [Spartobacteria bacterium]|nr:glycosyltransferase family 1 protein [Spartobacteria bacterium]